MNSPRASSIATRLPLAIAVLLFIVLSAMTVTQYVVVRRAAMDGAGERLDRVTAQIATMLGASAQDRLGDLERSAAAPTVIDFLRTGSDTARARLTEAFARAVAQGRETVEFELWDASGERVLDAGTGMPAMDPGQTAGLRRNLADMAGPAVGVLERQGDEAVYPVIAPVVANGRLYGYLVQRRRVASTEESVGQIRELIGSDARLFVGNTGGDVWTNLRGPTDGPPIAALGQTGVVEYTATTGDAVLARAAPVTLTPWLLVIEFPRTAVLAPARRFLASAAALSLIFVVAGAGTGWALTRRIVVPLGRLTDAAESIAAGQQVQRITSDRNDEVGRLAASFDTMAERVEEGRLHLETLVAERTAELEAANRELEAFSYSVSHDLRAPLRTVDGFAAVLTEDHTAQLTPDAQRCIAMIRDGAQQMGHLIDDLLTLSRLGRYPITPAHVDMHELASSVADEVRGGTRASAEIVVHPLPPAFGERLLLRQVLFNLVHNGIKFSRLRPVPRVEIGFTNGEDGVIYHVKDNGAGFDMRYADKLFGVFQRLHGSDEFEGTGVGLAIVHRLIQRHGGRVWAEAQVDRGATFYFALPPA